MHLTDREAGIKKMLQHFGTPDDVERRIGERERLRDVVLDKLDFRMSVAVSFNL